MDKSISIALIDHNDSFTFNIVESLKKINNTTITIINYNDLAVAELHIFNKIILSPGPCLPQDYPKTFEVIRMYYKTKPILGICLGHQAICSFFGAELYQFDTVVHGVNKDILINSSSKIFNKIPKKTQVGLYHSWAVKDVDFPQDLIITSKSKDDVIMSVEHKKYKIFGIQFHPESFLTVEGIKMLENFIAIE